MVRVPSALKIEDSTQSPGRIFNLQSSIQKVGVPWRYFLHPHSTKYWSLTFLLSFYTHCKYIYICIYVCYPHMESLQNNHLEKGHNI